MSRLMGLSMTLGFFRMDSGRIKTAKRKQLRVKEVVPALSPSRFSRSKHHSRHRPYPSLPAQRGRDPIVDEDGEEERAEKLVEDQRMRVEEGESPQLSGMKSARRPRLSAYRRAQLVYERIQEERRQRIEQRERDREQKEANRAEYESIKQRMNKVLKRRNRKGQPKLNAQMEVLLDKIQHRVKRDQQQS